MLPCTRFPTSLAGWLVSTGRQRLIKITTFAAVTVCVIALLMIAVVSGGVGAMVCNLMVSLAMAVAAAGSRVEGSTPGNLDLIDVYEALC